MPEFKKEVTDAVSIYTGDKMRSFPPETFSEEVAIGYRMMAEYDFLTETEFQEQYGHSARDVPGLSIDTLNNELGKPVSGIIVKTQAPRKLYVYSDTGSLLETCLHAGTGQLRANSGKEMQQWYQGELSKSRPKSWSSGGKAVDSAAIKEAVLQRKEELAAIQELAKQKAAAAVAAAAAADGEATAAAAAAEPTATPATPPGPKNPGAESSDDEIEDLVSPEAKLWGPEREKGRGKGRGGQAKGKAKAKVKAKAKQNGGRFKRLSPKKLL